MIRRAPWSTTSLAYWGWERVVLKDAVLVDCVLVGGGVADGGVVTGGGVASGGAIDGVMAEGVGTDVILVEWVLEGEIFAEYGETCCASPFAFKAPLP